MKPYPPEDAAVAVSPPHEEYAVSVRGFQRCVSGMKQLSFAGAEPSGGATAGDGFSTAGRVKCWGGLGAFWGGLWGWMAGATFFQNDATGPLRLTEPMAVWMTGAVEGGLMGGGMSAVGACVFSLMMPKRSSLFGETRLNKEGGREGSRQS